MGKKCTTKKYFMMSKNQRDISLELDKISKKIKIDYNAGLNIDRIILSNKSFFINNLGQEYWNTINDILKT